MSPAPLAEQAGPVDTEHLVDVESSVEAESLVEAESSADTESPAADPLPYGPGSATALPDGSPPGPDYTIKGNADSMLFHPPGGPYYKRTKAEVWFRTADDARAAGFTERVARKRAKR